MSGTAGSDEETFFNQWCADNARSYYSQRNGGVHRGGIMGHNAVELTSILDRDLDEQQLMEHNLLLYGSCTSNAILARFAGDLALDLCADRIDLVGRTYSQPGAAVFPHPLNPARYLAVHGATLPSMGVPRPIRSAGAAISICSFCLTIWSTSGGKCWTGDFGTTSGGRMHFEI